MDQIEDMVSDFESLLTGISASVAVIGMLGLGMMYIGSSIPLISEWKQNNPKAFRDVTWGLLFLMFAGSGGVAALVSQ